MKYKKEKLDAREKLICIAVYALLCAAAAWLFYDSIYVLPLFAPGFVLFSKAAGKMKAARHDEELTGQFLRAIVSVSSSIAAGISPENAFVTAAADMEKLYGKRSLIVEELGMINTQAAMGRRLSDALFEFAKRENIQEIYDFAVVFSLAKEKGGDFSSVISSCVAIMETKRQTETEARVLIRAKQYEQRVMCFIPPGILIYLRLSSGKFTAPLYHNPLGSAVMTGCLFMYVLAVCLSEKIGDVKV